MSSRLNPADQEGVFHFVTLNVRGRKKAFRREEYARLCVERLRFEANRHPAELTAFVVMPDHLHFLLWLEDGRLTRFLSRFKSGVTLAVDELARQRGHTKVAEWLSEKGKREFWQDGKFSLPLWTQSWIEQKIAYIHENPVRSGIVGTPEEFLWSSYCAYVPQSGYSPLVPVDIYNPLK